MEDAYVDGHQGVGSGWEDLESAHHAQQKASTTEEAPASQLHRQTDSACGHQPAQHWKEGHRNGVAVVPEMDSRREPHGVDSYSPRLI